MTSAPAMGVPPRTFNKQTSCLIKKLTIGIIEVMGRGNASVIQYIAISNIKYAHFMASTVSGLSPLNNMMGDNMKGANTTTHVLQNT